MLGNAVSYVGELNMENTGNKQNKENKYKRRKAQRRDWYQLDLSAIVYPTLQRRDFSSVYRLSVLLKEEVPPVGENT